ncbi:MAG TPA: LptF/LptG family permease, partial [Bacteroidia bacterium]
MKTLQRYMIKSFIGPFLMTFFIAVFVLFLQFLWKYVDDLIGKGLSSSTLAELFFYAALSMFPLSLPLAILLSSLMTFGNLGEQFELVALKSAGMSLQKIMMPLIIAASVTSIAAFFFSNNILPFVNLKMQSLIYDIQQKKPALNIKEGIFYNGIDGYTIRVEKKESDGINCKGIMIYDHTQNAGNNKVVTAESGKMVMSEDKQFLIIDLYNGTSYEEMVDPKKENVHPLARSKFKEQTIRFDLSGFRLVRSEEQLFKSNYAMLNIHQIDNMIDSLRTEKEKHQSDFRKNISSMLRIHPSDT